MTDTPAEPPAPQLPPPDLPAPALPAPSLPAPSAEPVAPEPAAPEADTPPAAPGRSWVKWLIPAGLVVVALVVVLVFVVGGDDAAGPPRGTAEAATAVADLVDGADLTDTTVAQIDCPVTAANVLVLAPESSDVADVVGDGGFSAVLEPLDSQIRLIECSFEGEGGRLAGISLGASPGTKAFEDAMTSYLPNHRLTFDEPQSWRGGTLFTYCGVPTDEGARNGFDEFCEADWVSDDLVAGVFASPSLADEAQLRAWLDAALVPIIDQLADR